MAASRTPTETRTDDEAQHPPETGETSTPTAPKLAEWEDFTGNYENFGSVDLGLSRDWSRESQEMTLIGLSTVGHVNGKSDIFRRDNPAARHQIAWCERGYKIGEAMLRQQGYALVTDAEWIKNPDLWEWEQDDRKPDVRYCVNYNDRAWARSEAKYLADKERRALASPVSQIVGAEQARHPGAVVTTDQNGRMLIAETR
jgi:hypothetical protein